MEILRGYFINNPLKNSCRNRFLPFR